MGARGLGLVLTLLTALPAAAAAGDAAAGQGLPLPARSATDMTQQPVRLPEPERQDLNERYGRVLATELGLLKALDSLDQRIEDTQARLGRLGARRVTATDALRQSETERAGAEGRLSEMRRAVRARLRALLRLRRSNGLDALMSPRAFASSVIEDRLLTRLLAGDRRRLAAYRQQLAQVHDRTTERNAALVQLDGLDADMHGEQASLERQRHDKLALITQIEADPLYNERARRDLDAANQQLLEKITTLKQWQERRYTFGRTRGKLLRPINVSQIEVPFGPRRHPRFGTVTFHRGVDIRPRNPIGAAVRAVFWARVAFVGWQTGFGNTVILDHGRGWHSVYAHVENIRVKVGDVVESRARLADVGASASLKGRYLYFEIREGGVPQDPMEWFR